MISAEADAEWRREREAEARRGGASVDIVEEAPVAP